MPTFHAAGDDAIRRGHNLNRLVADATAAGYRVETVWVVTDLEPLPVRIPDTPADGPVQVPVHAARAMVGTHPWSTVYDVGDAMSDLWRGVTVTTCAVTHPGPPCDGPSCRYVT